MMSDFSDYNTAISEICIYLFLGRSRKKGRYEAYNRSLEAESKKQKG